MTGPEDPAKRENLYLGFWFLVFAERSEVLWFIA